MYLDGYGFVAPQQFVADFGHLPTPHIVYIGKLTGTFLEAVREGKYGVAEGAVCKGGSGGEDVWMVKVKTYAYLKRLKKAFGAESGKISGSENETGWVPTQPVRSVDTNVAVT